MEDRLVKPADLGKVGVDVQRVQVSREAVDRRLLREGLFLDDGVRLARGRLVERGRGPGVLARLAAAEPARTANERGRVVLADDLAGRGVLGDRDGRDGGGFALVEHFGELGLGDELTRSRERRVDLEVLLAVQEHHGRKVGKPVDCG